MCDLVVSDLAENPCEPGLRIDFVQFCCLEEGEGYGHGFAAALGTGKHPVLSSDSHGFDGAFGCIAIGHAVRGAPVVTSGFSSCHGRLAHRDRGAGVRRCRQAELTMSCELALLSGRPCDKPLCAESAYP